MSPSLHERLGTPGLDGRYYTIRQMFDTMSHNLSVKIRHTSVLSQQAETYDGSGIAIIRFEVQV